MANIQVPHRFIPNPDGIESEWTRPEGILIPEVIYRAVHVSTERQVLEEGFQPGWDGLVYFADTANNAANFLVLRLPVEEIVAFAVHTKGIHVDLFDVGRDHSPAFFPGEVFTIEGPVSPEHLGVDMYTFSMNDSEASS